jgi:hypothetical protein
MPAYHFIRTREPKDEIELRIYGDGDTVDMPTLYMCEKCGDQFMNLDALGFSIDICENMFDLLKEYREIYGKAKQP